MKSELVQGVAFPGEGNEDTSFSSLSGSFLPEYIAPQMIYHRLERGLSTLCYWKKRVGAWVAVQALCSRHTLKKSTVSSLSSERKMAEQDKREVQNRIKYQICPSSPSFHLCFWMISLDISQVFLCAIHLWIPVRISAQALVYHCACADPSLSLANVDFHWSSCHLARDFASVNIL